MQLSQIKFKARILHVLSQLEVTGAETYAATIANAQIEQGHEVFIISDTFSIRTNAKILSLPVSNRRWINRILNIRKLRKFVIENKIDFVHAHSRAASWVVYFAVRGLKVPLISTVHGRQHIHRSSKGKDIYGERIIAVCENIKTHLISELLVEARKITMVPNALTFDPPRLQKRENKILSIIGRSSGPKGERISQIISDLVPSILNSFPDLQVQIVGAEWEKFSDQDRARMLPVKERFSNRIKFCGFVSDLAGSIANSSLVIASGRVAIETLWQRVPLIAVGESQTAGLVTAPHKLKAFESNFGDCSAFANEADTSADLQSIEDGIRAFFESRSKVDSEYLAEKVFERYNSASVLAQVEEVYLQARMIKAHPKHIPNLMYHKIPDREITSRHRIFVTKSRFEKQMNVLARLGYKAITFKQYDDVRSGSRPLSELPKKPVFITFDDGYVDNFTNALPIVKKRNLNFSLFALGDSSIDHNKWDTDDGDDRAEIMSLEQKKQLARAGVEFGAHSMSHKDMTTLGEDENLFELNQSRQQLETELGLSQGEVIVYAYPYGRVNEKVKLLTRKAGYKYAVATDSGGLHIEDDRYQIFRVNIFPEDSGFRFWKKIQPWYRAHYFKKRGQ